MVTKNGLDVICPGMYPRVRRGSTKWPRIWSRSTSSAGGWGTCSAASTRLCWHEKPQVGCWIPRTAGWSVIKAHEGERAMARELVAGSACSLRLSRRARCRFFAHAQTGKDVEEILRQGMIHQILANDRFWMGQPNVLVQRYEDLISQPARGVTELA